MKKFLWIMALFLMLGIAFANASTFTKLAVSTNTLYQNTNATCTELVYATGANGYLAAFVGSNTVLFPVANDSSLLSGGVGITLKDNVSNIVSVPPLGYYLFNYSTSNNIFTGEITSPCGGGSGGQFYSANAPLYLTGNVLSLNFDGNTINATSQGVLYAVIGNGMIPIVFLLLGICAIGIIMSFRSDDEFYKELGGFMAMAMLVIIAAQAMIDYSFSPITIGLMTMMATLFIFFLWLRFALLIKAGAEKLRSKR